jgi:DNA polymerase-3 subunit alpha
MTQGTIIIRFGDHNLDEYEFSPKSSVKEEPPAYLVEAAHLIMMNREPGFDLDSIPEDDLYILGEICTGHNDGVYLLEREGAECFIVTLAPTSIAGIIDAIALDCPGPLMAGNTFNFIERKLSNLPPQYIHPKLKPILKSTSGVVLYRKQVIEIAKVIAEYTQDELNDLSMTLAECKPGEINSHRKRFIDGAVRDWIDGPTAEAIFKQIAYFSSYDYLDEWQAAEHAHLAYRSAYMRHHYPEDYLVALDNTRIDRKATHETIEAPEHLNPLVSRLIKAKHVGQEYSKRTSEKLASYW